MSNYPFFRRAVRPALRRPAYYLIATVLGMAAARMNLDMDAWASFFVGLVALLAAATTLRAIDDDHASGTLEQLDVLPVPRWRIVLEIGAGSAVAYALVASIAMGLSLVGLRGRFELAILINTLPAIPALVLLGTLPPLRHRMGWPATLAFLGVLGLLVVKVAPLLFEAFWTHGTLRACAFASVHTLVYVALWALLWRLAHAIGGGWSGGEGARARRACPFSGATARGTPDGYNPLFWRELRLGRGWLLLMFAAGAYHIVPGAGDPTWQSPALRASHLMGWLGMWLCLASAVRTSSDRLSGMWGDLSHTPLSLGSILWCRVRGLLVQASLVGLGWFAVVCLFKGHGEPTCHAGRWEQPLLCAGGYLAAILAGFCTGTSGRGLLAGFGGLVLMYLMAAVSMIPTGLVLHTMSWTSNPVLNVLQGALAAVLALSVFYGTLIWGSCRGIRTAVESQRA